MNFSQQQFTICVVCVAYLKLFLSPEWIACKYRMSQQVLDEEHLVKNIKSHKLLKFVQKKKKCQIEGRLCSNSYY